jgi:type II secretory pathway pseudopilin PulG
MLPQKPNTPAGYGQPNPPVYDSAPGHPQYGPPPYPGQQWPGMAPVPYPQKKGMPGWAWLLIILGAVFALMIVGILALAAIPLITSNTRDARRAEGQQMLFSVKNYVKVTYAKTASTPLRLTSGIDQGGCNVNPANLMGKYYNVDDRVGAPNSQQAELYCTPVTAADGHGTLRFSWIGGTDQLTWH